VRHDAGVDVRFCAGPPGMLTWIAAAPAFMLRASHALVADGGVWLVDPVDGDGVRERVAALGPPRAVLQLLDRHGRDCAAMAASLDVPLHRTPVDVIPGAPFDVVGVRSGRGWQESALWWPARRALVVAEALGTAPYFRAPGQRIGPHPFMRLFPPRSLVGFDAQHVLVGHGDPLHAPDAGRLADEAVARARSSSPRWALAMVTGSVRRASGRGVEPG